MRPEPRWKKHTHDNQKHILTRHSIRQHWTYLAVELNLNTSQIIHLLSDFAHPTDLLHVAKEKIPHEDHATIHGLKQQNNPHPPSA
jgi:replication initiation and membrane attachment protein DnaB